MTTIQKFEEALTLESGDLQVLNADENVFVMVDEAHRTQYGILGSLMDKALPNATFLGFVHKAGVDVYTAGVVDDRGRDREKFFVNTGRDTRELLRPWLEAVYAKVDDFLGVITEDIGAANSLPNPVSPLGPVP